MNVFLVDGISTPVRSLEIEGENAPATSEVLRFSEFYRKENFSAARLTWVQNFVLRDLYAPRGYLRAKIQQSIVQPLPEENGAYPVRVVLHISSSHLYTFDSVRFEGLAREHAATLLAKWALKPGDPYDPAYVKEFCSKEILSSTWARHSSTETDVALPCAMLDEDRKAVALTITVAKPKKTYRYKRVEGGYECGEILGTLSFH